MTIRESLIKEEKDLRKEYSYLEDFKRLVNYDLEKSGYNTRIDVVPRVMSIVNLLRGTMPYSIVFNSTFMESSEEKTIIKKCLSYEYASLENSLELMLKGSDAEKKLAALIYKNLLKTWPENNRELKGHLKYLDNKNLNDIWLFDEHVLETYLGIANRSSELKNTIIKQIPIFSRNAKNSTQEWQEYICYISKNKNYLKVLMEILKMIDSDIYRDLKGLVLLNLMTKENDEINIFFQNTELKDVLEALDTIDISQNNKIIVKNKKYIMFNKEEELVFLNYVGNVSSIKNIKKLKNRWEFEFVDINMEQKFLYKNLMVYLSFMNDKSFANQEIRAKILDCHLKHSKINIDKNKKKI